jgi:nitroreductase
MSAEAVHAVLRAQRACRRYDATREVDDDLLRRILVSAQHAPSAENSQPVRFVVVRDEAKRRRITELTARAWNGGGRQFSESRLPARMLGEVDALATGGLADAPVVIVVCALTDETPAPALDASVWPSVQNLLVAAGAEGLGSTLTTLATHFADEVRAALGIPDDVAVKAVVPIGWPARPLGPPARKPLSEVAFADAWGQPLP